MDHSNTYLLVLGVVEPLCTSLGYGDSDFLSYAILNTMNTVCNFLFLIILNKHKVVTRYVFYISVCMICAYIELNSEGSLQNVKLTAIRTAAISLILIVSFCGWGSFAVLYRTSMHIIRKLVKPRQSLFEGLSEQ